MSQQFKNWYLEKIRRKKNYSCEGHPDLTWIKQKMFVAVTWTRTKNYLIFDEAFVLVLFRQLCDKLSSQCEVNSRKPALSASTKKEKVKNHVWSRISTVNNRSLKQRDRLFSEPQIFAPAKKNCVNTFTTSSCRANTHGTRLAPQNRQIGRTHRAKTVIRKEEGQKQAPRKSVAQEHGTHGLCLF